MPSRGTGYSVADSPRSGRIDFDHLHRLGVEHRQFGWLLAKPWPVSGQLPHRCATVEDFAERFERLEIEDGDPPGDGIPCRITVRGRDGLNGIAGDVQPAIE